MPTLRRQWLAVLLAAILAVAAPAQAALAQGNGGDNPAIAINDEDGSSEIDIEFDLHKVLNGMVDQTNAAVAYASCEECQTIAVAIQIVLVNSPVEVLQPHNLALAINENCVTCITVALAYQFVIGEPEKLRFTKEARKQLIAIAKALHDLEKSGGSADEIKTAVEQIVADLEEVLETGLESAGPLRDDRAPDEEADPESAQPGEAGEAGEDAAPTPSPEAGETPVPEGATPTPVPSETATPEPAPTETATPEPTATPTATAAP